MRSAPALPAGMIDVHTHAIAPALPDLSGHPGRWPSMERIDETTARILLAGRPYREIDDRCWSAERRLADMDAEGVAAQLVSPIPVTLCHSKPAGGAAALQDPARATTELVRCVRELGFLGVRSAPASVTPSWPTPGSTSSSTPPPTWVPSCWCTRSTRRSTRGSRPWASDSAWGCRARPRSRRPPCSPAASAGPGYGCASPTPAARCRRCCRGSIAASCSRAAPATARPRCARRELWCDSLAYDADSLRLAVTRFGPGLVVLGTDYPFAAREAPAGAVLDGLDDDLRRSIGRDNGLDMIAALHRESTVHDKGGPSWARSSASA